MPTNEIGGFGVAANSSACEDIDSVDILIRFIADDHRRAQADIALTKAFHWIQLNRGHDKGFVFKLYEPFELGHPELRSAANESGMLPTWFRTLSLLFLTKHLNIESQFRLNPCPGYGF